MLSVERTDLKDQAKEPVSFIEKQRRSKIYHFKVLMLRQYEDVVRTNEKKKKE